MKSPLIGIARSLRKRMTPEEVKLWQTLRRIEGWKFRRQVPIDGYIVDFACFEARLIIEVDGGQHGMPAGQRRDRARDAYLEKQGFCVLRFWNNQINRNMEGVMDEILPMLDRRRLEVEQENV
jgi:very-short-patch-repair endonuclease